MFELDVRSRLPVYEQLVEKFKQLIISEVLKADEQLPSVRVLAKQLTINPNTIQQAYRELERQGFIYSVKGKGSFAAPAIKSVSSEKLDRLTDELKKLAAEIMYLGMPKEDICEILSEIEQMVKGGDGVDTD